MAVLVSHLPESVAVECLPHKTWTRDEVALLESMGLFAGTHFELIDGELIDKMPKKRRHVRCVRETVRTLEAHAGSERVEQEAPIDLAPTDNPRNEPEPDVIVLNRPGREIATNPKPADIALVVEVADTTLRHDLTTKAALYARAGIPEYWVLDVNSSRLYVHRDPAESGYRSLTEVGPDGFVTPLGFPGPIPTSSLLS